jgi:DNA invertase Pin-like site-specific DNA recombinase
MGLEIQDEMGRMQIGYARVFTDERSLDLQLDALKKAGRMRVFTDKASTARADRPGLADAISHFRSGNVVVIWKLDRLGRTLKGLVEFVADPLGRGVQFRSLTDGIDTTTLAGRLHLLRHGISGSDGEGAHGRANALTWLRPASF